MRLYDRLLRRSVRALLGGLVVVLPTIPVVAAPSQAAAAEFAWIVSSPESIDFGNVGVHLSSEPVTVTVTSTGTIPLEIDWIIQIGPHYDFFAFNDECEGRSLPPGDSCQLDVVFHPTAEDFRIGGLRIYSNAPVNEIWMWGDGVAPQVAVSPTVLDFGGQEAGVTSPSRQVTVTNTGTVRLLIADVDAANPSFPPEFRAAGCTGYLDPGQSCQVSVTVQPSAVGPRSGELEISYTRVRPALRVPLRAVGTRPAHLSVKGPGKLFTGGDRSKVTLAINAGGTATYQLRVTNDDEVPRQFNVNHGNPGGSAVVRMYVGSGLTRKPMQRLYDNMHVTPMIPAGGSVLLEMTVKPPTTVPQATSRIDVALIGQRNVALDYLHTETNIKAPSKGTDAYGLFVKENSQAAVGGSVDGQTTTAPALPVGGTARFTATMRNDSKVRTDVRFSLTANPTQCWSSVVTVKEGLKTVDITTLAFGEGYSRSIAPASAIPVSIVSTRVATGCGGITYTARTEGNGVPGHFSFLLANPSV